MDYNIKDIIDKFLHKLTDQELEEVLWVAPRLVTYKANVFSDAVLIKDMLKLGYAVIDITTLDPNNNLWRGICAKFEGIV